MGGIVMVSLSRRQRRIARWTILGVAAMTLGWFTFGDALRPLDVETATPTRGTAIDAVYGTGVTTPIRRAVLRAPIAGRWVDVTADEGDAVAVEASLGRIDVPSLPFELARAEIELFAAEDRESSVPGVRALRAESAAVTARRELAEAERERAIALHERGVESTGAIQRLETELRELDAQASALRARRRDAEQGTAWDTERQEILVEQARARLAESIVRAPFDGVILHRLAEPAEWVLAGHALLEIGDISALEVTAEIDESDIERVSLGAEAVVRFHAIDDEAFTARVLGLAAAASRERGTLELTLGIREHDPRLRPGLSAEVNVITRRIEGALLVPQRAEREGRVWIVDEGRARSVAVEVGVRGTDVVQIRAGLDGDERILLEPPLDLTEGARVRPHSLENAAP
jgi:multidrug efflux pump subunit AcrA (membrane-fusion protein)